MEEFKVLLAWCGNNIGKSVMLSFAHLLIGGLLSYLFKFLPSHNLKQRDEWRQIKDRLENKELSLNILLNLNSTQRDSLIASLNRLDEHDEVVSKYCAVRESYCEIITELNDICSELEMSSSKFRKRFVKKNIIPCLKLLAKKGGHLQQMRKLAARIGKDKILWTKMDLDPTRSVVIWNSGLINLNFIKMFFLLRNLTNSYSV